MISGAGDNGTVRGLYPVGMNTTATNQAILDLETGQGIVLDVIRQQSIYSVGPGRKVYDDNMFSRAVCQQLNLTLQEIDCLIDERIATATRCTSAQLVD